MVDLFHSESLGGNTNGSWAEAQIRLAQERARKLNEAIADAPDKIIKLFTPKKRK